MVVPQTRFSPNALINDFVIRSTLGSGGMGTVYLAHQLSLDRPVALKILMEQFAHNSEFIVDFVREARAAARLNHPNIVQSYAVGEEDGIYFFAMEYVEGKTLKTLLTDQVKLPWEHAFSIIQQIAEALDFAWKNQQLVHRDIKPDNIMLTKRNIAKLADLGLARAAHETMDDDDEVMGTPQYICPEQLLGQPMDVRGDIYSLGATLFHGLTGNFPYEGNSAAEIARKHLNAPVPDPRDYDKGIPESASFVVKKMMAKRLEDRYEDAEELVMDIGFVLRGQKPAGFKPKNPSKKSYRGQKSGKVPSGRPTNTNMKKATMGGTKGKKGTGVFKAPAAPQQSRKPAASASQPQMRKPTPTKAQTTPQVPQPPAAVRPPSPPSPPQTPTSGDSNKMTKSSTGQVKSKTLRSTRTKTNTGTQSNVQDPASGNYRRPGAPPPKSGAGGKIALTILIFGILGMIGCIAVFIIQYVKYNFKDTAIARKCYLEEKISPEQRRAYNNVAIYFDNSYEDAKAPEVLKAANDYLKKYPNCLFSRDPKVKLRVKDWVKLYQVPLGLNMLAESIHKKATPCVGEVRVFRDNIAIHRVVPLYRKKKIEAEDAEIAKNMATYDFNTIKTQVFADIEKEAATVVGNYQEIYRKLQSQLQSNKSKFAAEKKKILKKVINITTNLDFAEAQRELDVDSRKDEELSAYPASVRVSIKATTAGREDYMQKAIPFLRKQLVKFANVPPIGGKMTLAQLEEHFESNAQSGVESAQNQLRTLPPAEREMFEARMTWFNNHKEALGKAVKYYFLVANSGKKYSQEGGWDKRRGIANRSNIGHILRHYGWHSRKVEEHSGDQAWIESITKNKMFVQIRRYDNDGNVARIGVEEIPLWEAHNHHIFHDVIANERRVKAKLGNFDECHACFEFYVRPSLFKAAGGSTNFLQGELQNARAGWNPPWGKTYIDIMVRGILFESSKDKREFLKKHCEKILAGTPVLRENGGKLEEAVNKK